jgi:NDP-sugar pyrophosphorylase family protein
LTNVRLEGNRFLFYGVVCCHRHHRKHSGDCQDQEHHREYSTHNHHYGFILTHGGFFVFDRKIIDLIHSDSEALENGALPRLARNSQLMAYHHYGFWKPMDALRDKIELDQLARHQPPPWLVK